MQERDGWYLFDGAQVSGPHDINHLGQLKSVSPSPQKLLVTRQGYDTWYPISHLERWFTNSETDSLKREIAAFQMEVERSAAALSGLDTRSIRKVEQKQVVKSDNDVQRAKQHKPKNRPHQAAQPARSPLPTNYYPATQPPIVLNIDPSLPTAHNYMLLKGRLRLGDLRSPGLPAMLAAALTLGVWTAVWHGNLVREIFWHTENRVLKVNRLQSLLMMLPFLACWSSYALAKNIRTMEMQNGYRSISPPLACVLGVLPPLAVFYIQSAANDHWLLHVKNCQ
jgi:hypothetical protein